jgi:ATP-dependent protease ClpP protease subunit
MDAAKDGKRREPRSKAAEIAVVGDVDDWEEDVVHALLEVPPGGECVFYIDSAGGSVFGALAVVTLIRYRKLKPTAVVLGECSSATLLLFAACPKRFVTPYSTLLFHPMRWESEKRIGSTEAVHWAKHFATLETDIDELQIRLFGPGSEQVREWTVQGQFITGPELVAAGLAQMVEI